VRRGRGDGGGGDGRGGGGGDLVPLEPPTTFRLLLYVLSSSSKQHSTWRQYQRQTFLSAFGMRRGGRMEVTPTYGLQLFYVLDRSEQSASTREEQARHDDLLVVRNATGCVSKIITGLRDAAVRERADGQIRAVLFSDDDAFIHPYRLLSDLAEHRATRRFVYGQIGWAAGWNPKQFSHFGYGNTGPEVFGRLYKDHLDAASEQGPYPYPYGFMMGVSIDLVRDIIGGFESTPSLIALEQHLALPRSTPGRKCSPPSDSGLGYILAQLRSNFTFVDVSSSERVHFWRAAASAAALQGTLSVMHGAKQWDNHFRWAACIVASLDGEAVESSLGTRCGPTVGPLKDKRVSDSASRCRGDAHCAATLGRYLRGGSVSWCSTAFNGPRRGRARRGTSTNVSQICNANFLPMMEGQRGERTGPSSFSARRRNGRASISNRRRKL